MMAQPGSKAELLDRILFALSDNCDRVSVAGQNFEKARDYSASVLVQKRKDFWGRFSGMVYENKLSG
jgi:hypothetical protein